MEREFLVEKFEFGDRILVKARIERHKYNVDENDQIIPDTKYRRWARYEYDSPKEAIFLGKRTLANGKIEPGVYSEDMDYFSADKYIERAWICIKGKNPQKVFLSDCEKIQG